jgi:hypothetical protein
MAIILDISPKNLDVFLNYMGGLHSHLRNHMMFFKPRKLDDSCVQEQYLENIGQKKGHPSGSKQKDHQEASKEGKKKCKEGKYKNTTTTTHQCKYLSDHFNHCEIDGHTK